MSYASKAAQKTNLFFGAHEKHSLRMLIMRKILRSKDAECNTKESP